MKEKLEFDKCGRLKYHKEFHFSHRKPFTESDKEYICKYHDFDDLRTLSFAIGKTETAIATLISKLKKSGKFRYYQKSNKYWGNVE